MAENKSFTEIMNAAFDDDTLTLRTSSTTAVPVIPDRPTTASLTPATISFATSGDHIIASGVSGQTIRVFRMLFVLAGATIVTLKSGSTPLTGGLALAEHSGLVLDFNGEPWYVTATDESFVLNTADAIQVGGTIWYTRS